MYRIELRDGLKVRHGSTEVAKFRTRKAAGLLAYLALHPGNHSRDKLLELFWPDLALDAARNALSGALSHLRGPLEKSLGQPDGTLLHATRDRVGLQPGAYATDLDALPPGFDPERILPGFYDDWALAARERASAEVPSASAALALDPLPAALNTYLGREELVERALALQAETRLLTLVGAGGVGKTRLALETLRAHEAEGSSVAWVELASLTDPGSIPDQIAAALGLESAAALVPALRARPVLLGLDNCEHLVAGVAREIERLLRSCPVLAVLATSREPLHVPGETILRLPGMTEKESATLFCERAARVRPGWSLAPEEEPLLATLCRRLDGLPLALELAAAKLRTLTLAELAERLEARLFVLTGGSRAAAPRQQTLRAAIGWSYDLLSEREWELFAALAVFHGGWTAEQAGFLCRGGALDLLDALADKSLIQIEHGSHGTRCRFLETVREFAVERLGDLPESQILDLRRRHLDAFFALAQSGPGAAQEEKLRWARRLDAERDNVRQALDFCRADRPERFLEFVVALGTYWELRGYLREARSRLDAALALPESAPHTAVRSRALNELAHACQGLGDWASARRALERLGETNQALGRQGSLSQRALLALNEGDLDGSQALFEDAVREARAGGDRAELAHVLSNYAQLLMAQGQLEKARAIVVESGDLSLAGSEWLKSNLALLNVLEGNLDEAHIGLQEILASYRLSGNFRDMAYCLCHFGMLACRAGEPYRAARLFGASVGWCERHGLILEQPERGFRESDMVLLHTEQEQSALDAAFEEGRAWSAEETYAQLTATCAAAEPPQRPRFRR